MGCNDLKNKLRQLNNEDIIWVVYLGIIILSFYSNHLERRYFVNNDIVSKDKYQKIITIIFFILVIVYLYFLKDAWADVLNLKPTDSDKKKTLVTLSFVASLLIAISGFLFLFIALSDNDLEVELAFS